MRLAVQEALITKYRPKTFDEVVGQDPVVRSLKASLEKGTSKTFLFSGPPGTGKTTLARLVAKEAGCLPNDLLEIDAATYTGIDDIRNVTADLAYKPLGKGAIKAIIIDEAHALSKAAIQALLKALEEPPAHIYWFLCTTEPTRLPESIRTRCTHYALKPVALDVLAEMLDRIVEKEKLPVEVNIVDLCAKEAGGSPRQALANLSVCVGAKNIAEARGLLRSAETSEEAINLARALVKGAGWPEIQQILNGLAETNPESVRHVVRAYVSKVVLGANRADIAGKGVEILSAFEGPFHPADGITPVIIACATLRL